MVRGCSCRCVCSRLWPEAAHPSIHPSFPGHGHDLASRGRQQRHPSITRLQGFLMLVSSARPLTTACSHLALLPRCLCALRGVLPSAFLSCDPRASSLGIPLLVRLASSDDTQLPLWSPDRSEHVVSSQQNVSAGYMGCASRLAVVRDCGRGAPPLPTRKRLTCHKIDLCHPSYLALHLHIFPRRSSSTVFLPLLMLRSA